MSIYTCKSFYILLPLQNYPVSTSINIKIKHRFYLSVLVKVFATTAATTVPAATLSPKGRSSTDPRKEDYISVRGRLSKITYHSPDCSRLFLFSSSVTVQHHLSIITLCVRE